MRAADWRFTVASSGVGGRGQERCWTYGVGECVVWALRCCASGVKGCQTRIWEIHRLARISNDRYRQSKQRAKSKQSFCMSRRTCGNPRWNNRSGAWGAPLSNNSDRNNTARTWRVPLLAGLMCMHASGPVFYFLLSLQLSPGQLAVHLCRTTTNNGLLKL